MSVHALPALPGFALGTSFVILAFLPVIACNIFLSPSYESLVNLDISIEQNWPFTDHSAYLSIKI
jgi:hypothetical protein